MTKLGYWERQLVRRVSRRRALAAFAGSGAALAALSLVGCGGGDGEGGKEEGAASGDKEAPRTGGILNYTLHTDPSPNLDPHQTTTFTTVWPAAPTLNQLVQFDPNKPGDTLQDIVPDLAERWEQPDNLTMVFTLRRDATWHDGSPLTSEDVKTTLEWLKKAPQGKPNPRSGTQITVERVEVPDANTVRIRFSRPTASYLMNLASHYFAMGQAKDLKDNGEIGSGGKIVGTGPFRLKSYQRSNTIELERNPTYHVKGRPYLDGIKFFIVPDYTTQLTNLIAGQYHLYYRTDFKPSDAERVVREAGKDKIEVQSVPGYSREPVFMNATRKPYGDIRVRQAINLAIDRDAAIKVIREGGARRGGYMAPTGVWAIPESELRKFDGYDKPDLAKAKQLLSAAGVATPLEASSTTRTDFQFFAEFVQDQLNKIGINMKITLGDTATAQPVLIRGDFDIGPWNISINVDDPDATFSELATSTAARNWSRVYDPQIDELFEKQSTVFNFEERKRIVQELEKRALSQYQIAVLEFYNLNHARYKSVHNWIVHESLYTNRHMESTWLKS